MLYNKTKSIEISVYNKYSNSTSSPYIIKNAQKQRKNFKMDKDSNRTQKRMNDLEPQR